MGDRAVVAPGGAKLLFNYQGERVKDNVEELAGTFGADTLIYPCDVVRMSRSTLFWRSQKETDRIDLLCTAWPSRRARRSTPIFNS